MSNTDFDFTERLMYQRVEEELRQAKLRQLQREAGETRQGRVRQWTSLMVDRLGSLLVSMGQSLQQVSRVQLVSTQEHADDRV